MNYLENIPWERLLWDANRLVKPTQRHLHATAQERAGAATTVTERSARDIAPFIDPANLETSLNEAYDAYNNPEQVRQTLAARGVRPKDVHKHLKFAIWWAEEWLRPDSPYKVRVLTDEERERALDILDHMARHDVFDQLTSETAGRFPDAMIIAEAGALGRRYIVTEDQLKEAVNIDHWARQAYQDGLLTEPELIIPADTALRTWAADHQNFALETVATAFWPPHDDASAHEVAQKVTDIFPKLSGALLITLADTARRERDQTNDWPSAVERMRETLPQKTRAADRRHPTNPRNQDRDWSEPQPELLDAITRRRWKIDIQEHATHLAEVQHDGTYRTVKTFPAGAERALTEYLINHDIEVSSLPRHGGRNDTSSGDSGFSAALSAAIEDERSREIEL